MVNQLEKLQIQATEQKKSVVFPCISPAIESYLPTSEEEETPESYCTGFLFCACLN